MAPVRQDPDGAGGVSAEASGPGEKRVSAVEVLRTGMVTGVGLDAPTACAAIRAGIAGFEETQFMYDGEWLLGCEVPLQDSGRGREKLLQMVVPAIEECLEGLGRTPATDVPLFLGVAGESRPGRFSALDDTLIPAIEERLGIRFHSWSRVFANGRIGTVQALDYARRVLTERIPYCVVAAVDTLLVVQTLDAYHEQHRLLTAANSDGFIPGEGAAAALVGPVGSGGGLRCVGVGYGVEPAPRGSGQPMRAEGMVQAFQGALADASWEPGLADYRIADVSGEQYSFREAALALARVLRTRKEEFQIWHPADCVGETGAAAPLVMLAVACSAVEKAYAPGPRALAHVAGDGTERAAFLLEASRATG